MSRPDRRNSTSFGIRRRSAISSKLDRFSNLAFSERRIAEGPSVLVQGDASGLTPVRGEIRIIGPGGAADIKFQQGESLADIAARINTRSEETRVIATSTRTFLRLDGVAVASENLVRVEALTSEPWAAAVMMPRPGAAREQPTAARHPDSLDLQIAEITDRIRRLQAPQHCPQASASRLQSYRRAATNETSAALPSESYRA